METDIDFDLIGIAEVIKRDAFIVPSNQREYAWLKNVQVKDLLQDINNAIRNNKETYFLGTVVLTKNDKGSLEIADGQQRLATTTMILAAIRDYFLSKGDTDMYRSIENDFLFTYDRKEKETVSKLTLNLDDNDYFKNTILSNKTQRTVQTQVRRSHKLLHDAYQTIIEYFDNIEKQLGEANTKDQLNNWLDFLLVNARIVKLVVKDAESAFIMFETLNDRGLKTSQADLVKNHLFGKSDVRLPEAQKLWSSMKGAIETVSNDDDDITMEFLRLACCVITGATREKDVMKKVQDISQSKNECIRTLTLFEELSKDFAAIINPDHQKWNGYDLSVRKSIQTINLLGVTQIRPLMLAIARYFNANNTALAFKKIVAWSVRFMIMNIKGGRLDEGYARLAFAIFKQEIKNESDLKKQSEKLVVTDAEFSASFETTKVSVSKLARYYLRSLENTARQEPNPEFLPNEDTVINLEHIMPQSLKNGWDNLTEQDVETHFSRIGNMVLLQANTNSTLGDCDFETKKKAYALSSFTLTNQLASLDRWNTQSIDERQKLLAKLAVQTWPI